MPNFRPHAPLLAANFSTAFSCFLRSHETSLIDGWGSTALEHALYMAELNTRRSRQPSSIAKFLDFLQAAKQLFCGRFALFSRESLQSWTSRRRVPLAQAVPFKTFYRNKIDTVWVTQSFPFVLLPFLPVQAGQRSERELQSVRSVPTVALRRQRHIELMCQS